MCVFFTVIGQDLLSQSFEVTIPTSASAADSVFCTNTSSMEFLLDEDTIEDTEEFGVVLISTVPPVMVGMTDVLNISLLDNDGECAQYSCNTYNHVHATLPTQFFFVLAL